MHRLQWSVKFAPLRCALPPDASAAARTQSEATTGEGQTNSKWPASRRQSIILQVGGGGTLLAGSRAAKLVLLANCGESKKCPCPKLELAVFTLAARPMGKELPGPNCAELKPDARKIQTSCLID